MARHNRDAQGLDQRGAAYRVSFQPDWLHQIRVTRTLESGRQSTKTLVRNTDVVVQEPGRRVRTRIADAAGAFEFEIVVDDPRGVVARIIVETVPARAGDADLGFVIVSRRGAAARRADAHAG